MDFDELVRSATGHDPYPYQRGLALKGSPEVLVVPTGAGKTLAAVLPWLWRRRYHPDTVLRRATPRRLIYALPMRVLVEQTHTVVESWIKELGLLGDVGVYKVLGGEGRISGGWRDRPEQDAVFVGTIDMLLSRALNRGYGDNRWIWPIDFGILNSDTHWVFDEVQLLGPGLPTGRQLDAFRRQLGTAAPSSSMWMSATVDEAAMATVDNPGVRRVERITAADRIGPLEQRLTAPKRLQHHRVDERSSEAGLAALAMDRHRMGTLTIVICNTVRRAAEVHRRIAAQIASVKKETELVLLHSRFRPTDRERRVQELSRPLGGGGRIVVSTQVIEAGVDVSAAMLLTELAPWPSVVQRAGRCNRTGDITDATMLWVDVARPEPYEQDELDVARAKLQELDGTQVTPDGLGAVVVEQRPTIHAVLRRWDLLDLFDTTPDLSGNDVDVSRFIRTADDTDVAVAWWALPGSGPDPQRALPARDERCPVSVAELREWIRSKASGRGHAAAWRYDHLDERWVPCGPGDVRPGGVVVLDAALGGYDPERGWDPRSTGPVEEVRAASEPAERERAFDADVATGSDPISITPGRWLSLLDHLADVEAEVRRLIDAFDTLELPAAQLDAAIAAGRLHDIGKAHPVFQRTMERAVSDDADRQAADAAGRPWAKSPRSSGTHERRYFRHELASALALLDAGQEALAGLAEVDLAVYLVAAHHGRVRIGLRSLPDERAEPPTALGIEDGEPLPEVAIPGGRVPASTLRLDVMGLGETADGRRSWAARALALRDRPDLGPFRLAFLEALVRLADWRTSAAPGGSREDQPWTP